MRVSRCLRRGVAAAALVAGQTALVPLVRAQGRVVAASAPAPAAAAAAPAAPATVCGATPSCAESNDFAAMVTNFRTSDARGYKIIDVVVRFRNKTASPLVLGYLQGSGTAVDEKGNRYSVYGGNGVRGIGQVYGNSFDSKFTLSPGGVGDAQFELAWYPGQQIYGFTFLLDLTIDEINSYEGNQHSLGGEFPLHYEGLTNGVSNGTALAAGAIPGAVPGASPCSNGGAAGTAATMAGATGSTGVQNAAGQAATASSAVSSITSLFHHKKAQPAGAPGADPCASAAPAAVAQTAPVAAGAPAVQQVKATTPGPVAATATAAGAIAPAKGVATIPRSGAVAVKAAPAATVKPVAATVKTVAATPAKKPDSTTSRTAGKP